MILSRPVFLLPESSFRLLLNIIMFLKSSCHLHGKNRDCSELILTASMTKVTRFSLASTIRKSTIGNNRQSPIGQREYGYVSSALRTILMLDESLLPFGRFKHQGWSRQPYIVIGLDTHAGREMFSFLFLLL